MIWCTITARACNRSQKFIEAYPYTHFARDQLNPEVRHDLKANASAYCIMGDVVQEGDWTDSQGRRKGSPPHSQ